jgi:hypothetical protein
LRTHRFSRQNGYHLAHLSRRDTPEKGLPYQLSDFPCPPLWMCI